MNSICISKNELRKIKFFFHLYERDKEKYEQMLANVKLLNERALTGDARGDVRVGRHCVAFFQSE